MKIGIVTINDHSNYGNRLQNYAVFRLLQNYGHFVETITVNIKEKQIGKEFGIKQVIKKLLPCRILFSAVRLNSFVKAVLTGDVEIRKTRNFYEFSNAHIQQKHYYVKKYEDLNRVRELKKYDYILTGSDQVWNPYFAGSDYYFLTFVPPEKRIAFIASIGIPELPNDQKERYAALLKQMHYISVREESAVRIIEELIHKKVDCFLDPVLLLEKENWENLMKSVAFSIPEKYILSFFLGEEPNEKIELFAHNHNLKVVHMNRKEYKEYYPLGPEQLLYVIKNAAIVMTDSFHVTAFSIIFQRQFYVFRRKEPGMENMFSRMETLLGKFYLTERIQDSEEFNDMEDISVKQYLKIEKILTEERNNFDKAARDKMFLKY